MSSEDEYDFYPCLVDQAPASIYVNLRYERDAPLAGAETRYALEVQMLDAGPHGIGSAEEATTLDAIEEAVIARLAQLVYVGRLRTSGVWEATWYGPPGHADAFRAVVLERAGDRRVVVRSDPDPGWRYYRELLLPDAERRRWMDDRRIVQVLKGQGDMLVIPRRVDHRVSFTSARARDAFLATAVRHGFTLERLSHQPDRERPFAVQVFRMDAIELDHIHDVVMMLVDAAEAHGGRYERWEAMIQSA